MVGLQLTPLEKTNPNHNRPGNFPELSRNEDRRCIEELVWIVNHFVQVGPSRKNASKIGDSFIAPAVEWLFFFFFRRERL